MDDDWKVKENSSKLSYWFKWNEKLTLSWLLKQQKWTRIAFEDINVKRYIGAGKHGAVYEATLADEVPFAVKFLRDDDEAFAPQKLVVHRCLRHENIVQVFGYSFDKEREHHIVAMEMMEMNLEQLIRKHQKMQLFPFGLEEAIQLMLDICQGIRFLNRNKLAFTGFKVQNVLVSFLFFDRRQVKLSSSWLHGGTEKAEKAEKAENGASFAFGKVCYQILTGKAPEDESWELPPEYPEELHGIIHSLKDGKSDFESLCISLGALKIKVAGERITLGASKVKRERKMPAPMMRAFATGKQPPVMILDIKDLANVGRKKATGRVFRLLQQPSPIYQNGLRIFSWAEISGVINKSSVIGRGGSSRVHRGRLKDGLEVAIKVFNERSVEFLKEIEIKTNHKNLLSPVGYSAEKTKPAIVYEYMPSNLMLELSVAKLQWDLRMKIAIGVAEGLACLHDFNIVHRDVQPSTVLLDSHREARLTSMGQALVLSESSEGTTREDVRGRPGFVAPEYFMSGQVSTRSDVYSFGVLLLQLISGESAISLSFESHLARRAKNMLLKGQELQLADLKLEGKFSSVQLKNMVELAISCTRESSWSRPTMQQVVSLMKFEESDLSDVGTPYTISRIHSLGGSSRSHYYFEDMSARLNWAALLIQAAWRGYKLKTMSLQMKKK